MDNTPGQKKVLVCPLDWGLGHATRCIPVINELIRRNCIVLIASSGDALVLLKKEFPDLAFFVLTGYAPHYAGTGFVSAIARQLPKFLRTINTEHKEIDKIITAHAVDVIISDNRYGCWSERVPTVIITHQLTIQSPVFQGVVNYFNHRALRKFNAVWVPDYEGDDSLAGKLSETLELPVTYIGTLSRFEKTSTNVKYDILAIVSGPEPTRTSLEKMLGKELDSSGRRTLLVKGRPSAGEITNTDATEVNHLSSVELNEVMNSAELIISRPGYTTLMDLQKLGKKAILIPTPGQTEQEYLGKRMMDKGICLSVSQKDFHFEKALEASGAYGGFEGICPNTLLTDAVKNLLR